MPILEMLLDKLPKWLISISIAVFLIGSLGIFLEQLYWSCQPIDLWGFKLNQLADGHCGHRPTLRPDLTAIYKATTTQNLHHSIVVPPNPSPLETTIIDFSEKEYDPSHLVNTGGRWAYKAQVAGIYQINATITLMSLGVGTTELQLVVDHENPIAIKNPIAISRVISSIPKDKGTFSIVLSRLVKIEAGQTVSIYGGHDASAQIMNTDGGGKYNYISINYIGPAPES